MQSSSQHPSQHSLDILNSLVQINTCRIEGYERAAIESEGYTLKALFARMADTSRACKYELSNEIKKLGYTPTDEAISEPEIACVWQEMKLALAGKNRKAILNACERGERAAEKMYREALDKIEIADMDHRSLVKKQYAMIKFDHEKIRNLRNALMEFN
jgi:uncharacterized protein (TIGR02284 family)